MVYLIHFSIKYKHAQHYLGYCEDNRIENRLTIHWIGKGARLIEVITDELIEWSCVRLWYGAGQTFERKLKRRKESPYLCPVCNPERAWQNANQFPNSGLTICAGDRRFKNANSIPDEEIKARCKDKPKNKRRKSP